mgnify:CR=1 FL=1
MDASDPLAALNRLFVQALLRLGDAGEIDAACRLAAQGWSLLRHDQPKEAERLNGAMHNLTNPRRNSRREPSRGDGTVLSTPTKKETHS